MTKEITKRHFYATTSPDQGVNIFILLLPFGNCTLFSYPYSVMANFSMKLASTVSAAAIVATSMSASLVSAASEFLPYAEALATNKVIGTQATEAGYRLNDQITRAELAKVAANLGQYTAVSCTGKVFTDVNKSLGDLCDAIETLAAAKVINTNTTTFRPTANVTRAEMTKMLLGALGETPSSTSAGYTDVTDALGDLAGFINRANEMKCANTATYFRPNANSSRGEAFKIASCTAGLKVDTTKPTDTNTGSTVGTMTVSAVGSAVAQYVPMNASSVKVGTFKITANGGDVTVNNVTIGRSGLGNSQNVTISLTQNGQRVSESRTVNTSTQESQVRLNSPIVLKNGESVELSALVSVNGQANAQHQFSVNAVNGTAVTPVTLGLINTTSYTTATTTVDNVTLRGVTSGRNDQNFASVTLRAGNQDTTISGFTLTKTSGVDLTRALANVKVYRNGTAVGTVAMTSDKIIVSGLATDLTRNNSAVYELRGDVTYVGDGSNSDDLVLNITETEDVSATEKSTGFTTQTTPFTLGSTAKVDLSSLDITVTRKPGNTTTTVAPGASNVTFLDGTIASSATFDVTKFTLKTVLYPTGTGVTASGVFSSLILTVAGNDIDLLDANGSLGVLGAAGGEKSFSASADKFRVDAGAPVNVQLRGTLRNTNMTGNVQFSFIVNDVKNIGTGNTTTGFNKVLSGHSMKISAPEAALRQATVSAPSGSKIFSNATDLEIGRFAVEAKADEVSVNKIVITNSGTLADLNEAFTNVRLIDIADGSTIASSAQIDADKFTFNSVSLRVAKDTVRNVKIVADTNSNLTSNTATAGKTFQGTVNIATSDVSSNTAANTAVSGTPLTLNKTYDISTNTPSLQVTALPLVDNGAVAKVKITNTDPNADLDLEKVKLRVSFRSTANGTAPNLGDVCIRNVGSSQACNSGSAEVLVGTLTNGEYVYDITSALAGFQAKDTVSDNNGVAEFEVFITNAPVWVAGDNVSTSVSSVKYRPEGGSSLTESYVGVAGASAVATK